MFIYFRERGREGERKEKARERKLLMLPQQGTWPTTQACALTGNGTGDPSICRPAVNPLSHTGQGRMCTTYSIICILLTPSHKSSSTKDFKQCSKRNHWKLKACLHMKTMKHWRVYNGVINFWHENSCDNNSFWMDQLGGMPDINTKYDSMLSLAHTDFN